MSDPTKQPTPLAAAAVPPLPYGMTREQAVESLFDLRNLATAAQRDSDPGFGRWPVLDALMEHIAKHGLPPIQREEYVERYVIGADGSMRVEWRSPNATGSPTPGGQP